LETELLGFLDTSAAQNLPNTVKTLYTLSSNNTIAKNDEKFKINATGWQGVNCPSIIQFTTNTKAHEFAKILINIRLINTESKEAYKIII